MLHIIIIYTISIRENINYAKMYIINIDIHHSLQSIEYYIFVRVLPMCVAASNILNTFAVFSIFVP